MTETTHLKNVIEAALLAAGKPLQITELAQLFEEHARPDNSAVQTALDALVADYEGRGIEVKETATGFRIQVRKELAPEVSRLWPERPPRYSRALLETLALIAYRQPITRAEIEAVRGVAVNPNIIKTLLERGWVRVVGTRDVPGRPELLGTTREFLDYFSLRSLDELPPLAEVKAMTDPNLQLALTAATPTAALAVDGLSGDAAAANGGETTGSQGEAGASSEAVAADSNSADAAATNVADAAAHANGDAAGGVAVDSVNAPAAVEASADSAGTAATVSTSASDAPGADAADETRVLTDGAADYAPITAGGLPLVDATATDHASIDASDAANHEPIDAGEEVEVAVDDDGDAVVAQRTIENHNNDDEDDAETRKAHASDDIGFDDELSDDDDEDDIHGNSAELVAARRDYED